LYLPATVEPDTGCAANDDDCRSEEEPPASPSRTSLALVGKHAEQSANDEHDDYYLGGYAGI
jgi:hypothetical protein